MPKFRVIRTTTKTLTVEIEARTYADAWLQSQAFLGETNTMCIVSEQISIANSLPVLIPENPNGLPTSQE